MNDLIGCGYLVEVMPKNHYSTDNSLIWTASNRRELKPVKGKYAPARYAITWDGYEPGRVKLLWAKRETPTGQEYDLTPEILRWTENLCHEANNLTPVAEFPYRAWLDDY